MAKQVLGKGLKALIPQADLEPEEGRVVLEIEVSAVKPNPYQLRTEIDRNGLEELKSSIVEKGLIQPITVRRSHDGFELIAGERRLRAAKEMGMKTIPAIVMDISEEREFLELALIENVQRENLNPIEEARAYKKLMDECGLTQEEVSRRVGKDRSTITNFIRLLRLPEEVQSRVMSGKIYMGHARALLSLNDPAEQIALCQTIARKGLSVRRVEEIVREKVGEREIMGNHRKPKKPEQLVAIEQKLEKLLGTRVRVKQGLNKGKIEIEFYSSEDLDRIVELLTGELVEPPKKPSINYRC